MGRMRVIALGLAAAAILPVANCAYAQVSGENVPKSEPAIQVGGKSSFDLIRVTSGVPSVPLRNPGVIPNSEEVQLDGVPLKRGEDYTIDNQSGVIYLKRLARDGQRVRVSYRYEPIDPSKPKSQSGLLGKSSMMFNLGGGTSAVIGMGIAERMSDGRVFMSNVYGLRNSMNFGQGSLKGMFIVGERKEVQTDSLLDGNKARQETETGKSQAIVQQLETRMLGGTVKADLVDIQKNFSGFQAFRDAGFEDGQVNQFSKEKGLRRVGMSFNGIGGKGLGLSYGYRAVKDKDSNLEWRTLGFDTGPLKFNWYGQHVDEDFTRFGDLAEQDREWLAKEKGLTRESMSASYTQKTSNFKYDALKVEDGKGQGLYRRSGEFNLGGFKLGYKDQHVEQGFERFGNLREGDRDQLARERGWRRQEFGFDYAPAKIHYAASQVRAEKGKFASVDFSISGKNWSFDHARRSVDAGFNQVGNLAGPEIGGNMAAIARMYQKDEIRLRGEEGGQFVNGSSGLDRSGFRLQSQLFRGIQANFEGLDLKGQEGGVEVRQFNLGLPKASLSYRHQNAKGDFKELGGLMQFERDRLSVIPGLDKTDFSLASAIGQKGNFAFQHMRASTPTGEAERTLLALTLPRFDFLYRQRDVSKDFTNIGQITDQDREILAQMIGFNQKDLYFKNQQIKNLTLELNWADGFNADTGEKRLFKNSSLIYSFDKQTEFKLSQFERKSADPKETIYGNRVDRIDLMRNFGKLGILRFAQETRNFDGRDSKEPDSKTDIISYETKVLNNTSVRTEQARTTFSDGNRETVSNNSIETKITPRIGINVSQATVQRSGDKTDETRRNYGFWIDFGKGIKLQYGYNRSLIGEKGEYQGSVALTPGQFQGIDVRNMTYQAQRWDGARNLAVGNVNIGTSKPLQMGPIRDIQFSFGADTQRDMGKWQRENRRFGISSSIGGVKLGYDFFSQVGQDGKRAIDRTYRFETPGDDKVALKASAFLKVRCIGEKTTMVRNYNLSYRPASGIQLSHQVVANPETPRGDVILGSVLEPTRINRWSLGFDRDPSTKFAVSWEERLNERDKSLSRLGAVSFTLFANKPSPLYMTYGLEQTDLGGVRRTAHRYGIRFDQRPGPNQTFSFSMSNLNWQHSRAEDQKLQNWQFRMDYQLRF